MRHTCAMIVIEDHDRAKEISTALTAAFDSIGSSLVLAREACNESQLKEYNRHVGDLFYIITFKLLEPLYQQHPELRPEDWDDKPLMDPD